MGTLTLRGGLKQNFDQRIGVRKAKEVPLLVHQIWFLETLVPGRPTSDNRIMMTESSNPEHAIAIPQAPLQDLNTPGFGTDDSDRYTTSIQNTSSPITPPSHIEGISSPCHLNYHLSYGNDSQ